MRISLPKYSTKDYVVMPLVVLPFTFCINAAAFGTRYFSTVSFFVLATVVCGICFSLYFIICGAVAVLMKKRFPGEEQLSVRLSVMIFSFLVMSGLFLVALFNLFASIRFFQFSFSGDVFVWSYFSLGIINVFLTFLMEGVDRYENWKRKQQETDLVKASYRRSRLLGLKSQVNPHFLFNSLNSLSSLISENEETAEKFLDEMSKVYRYMLRGEDDSLVTLETELKFLQSYYYLLQARYGTGLQVRVQVREADKEKYIPALTLQVIIENAFTQNSIQKNNPLLITIATEDDFLILRYNLQPKLVQEDFDAEAGLDNLVGKYHLLEENGVQITDADGHRTLLLPLLKQKKEVLL